MRHNWYLANNWHSLTLEASISLTDALKFSGISRLEFFVLCYIFGLDGKKEKTISEVAMFLNAPNEITENILNGAIAKIKKYLKVYYENKYSEPDNIEVKQIYVSKDGCTYSMTFLQ